MSGGAAPGWAVTALTGPAAELHARPWPDPLRRALWVLTPERPALVLGSTQRDTALAPDALAARGIEVAHRRSGGGAVLLDETAVWVDVFLPAADPLWDDDIGRSFLWLGRAWQRALAAHAVAADVHPGPFRPSGWSSLVCFAGLGAGELIVDGRKVLGLSQRRTRVGARFQCVAYLGPAGVSARRGIDDLLAVCGDVADRAALRAELEATTATLPLDRDDLVQSLVTALPGTSTRSA